MFLINKLLGSVGENFAQGLLRREVVAAVFPLCESLPNKSLII